MSTESLEYIGKFIGPDEVTLVSTLRNKTPGGDDMLFVEFKGGKTRTYPKKAFELMLTDTLSDYTAASDKRLAKIAHATVELIKEYDITVGDMDRLLQKIAMGLEEKFNQATSYLYWNTEREYTMGFNPMYDVSLNMAQSIIDETNQRKGDTATEPEGN